MPWKHYTSLGLVFLTPFALLLVALSASGERRQASSGAPADLWVHPRDDAFDPKFHYKDGGGELYYHAENDIARGLGRIVIRGDGDQTVLSVDLGRDLTDFVAEHGGGLHPVVHYDGDGDGRVDRSIRGGVDEGGAWFGGAELGEIDFLNDLWQLGIVYRAGSSGAASYNGRYLASVSSRNAQLELPPQIAEVEAGPPPGLVIYRHRDPSQLQLAAFEADPTGHLEGFQQLTRSEDADDWTVKPDGRGKLRTHFEQADLLLVQVAGAETTLDLVWGDMALEEYLREGLLIPQDDQGCYSSDDSRALGDDGSHRELPNRILYCPERQMALFDAPDGYEIVMAAFLAGEKLESTEASTSIWDNIKLYADQVHERSPRGRGTGTVGGNMLVGFKAAGDDIVDMGRHLVVGSKRTNIHTGQEEKRTSLLAAAPLFLWGLAQAKPVTAVHDLFEGVSSGVQVAADAVSAVNNAVINPLVQGTVGVAASPAAANETGHWVGALTQAWAKNLPGSERTFDAFSPLSLWRHDRAFRPTSYTRTDTQLNIDRVISAANAYGLYAVVASATSGSGGGGGGNSGGGGGGSSSGGGNPAPINSPPAPPPAATPPPAPPPMPGC